MSAAEKWPEVERLFHAALAHDEPARAPFLREACGDDDALRREVESLIAYAANDRALTLPAMQAVAVVQQRSRGVAPPPLSSGTLVGSYTIVELLGAGGMGEVYRAHDSSLRRDIALKMLTSPPAGDDDQRTRILREARAAAALNHPHICTIHEVGDADGRAYIAMEVVEGPSLSTRVAQGPLSIPETLRCGVELADAVSHAHERGIVHRDLKSANVMLTHDGRVKVLDFGLAKHVGASEAEATVTRAAASPSQSGGRFGTVPYMSPEQLRGLPADARSDVWAIGVILYEMVAGIRPFTAATSFELASLILHDPPAPLPSAVPPSLRAVIDRCLQKEPRDRYERAADLLSALRSIEHDRAIAVVATSGARGRRGPWAAAVAALVAAIAGVIWVTNRSVGEQLLADGQPPIRSLAVLPLTNASGNPDEAHFVEGMHDALITDLARLGLPRVIAKTSADMFKAGNQSLTDIGKQLGVDGLVTASVMRIDGRVRLTARLVRTSTGAIVWANRYERSAADILSLQNELVGAIAREIHATLSPEQTEHLSTSRRVNPAAHDAYLKGRSMQAAFANLPDRQRLDAAVAQYEHSIRLDPTYAPPYAALSVLYQNGAQASLMPPTDTLARARAAALKSVELDDCLPEGHGALAGVFLWFEWNWAAANREIQRALELNPHSPDVLTSAVTYAALVSASVDEATRVSQHILDVDPLNPFSRVQTVWSAFFTRRYDDAISRAKALLDVWPDNIMGPWFLSSTYAVQRNAIGVGASCRQVMTLLRGAYVMQPLAMCAWAFGTVGLTDEARRLLSIVENPPPGLWLDPAVMGNAYGPLDKDRAFEWYERGFAERSPNMIYMRVGAPWDATRDDSRFESLLRRMNFPE